MYTQTNGVLSISFCFESKCIVPVFQFYTCSFIDHNQTDVDLHCIRKLVQEYRKRKVEQVDILQRLTLSRIPS